MKAIIILTLMISFNTHAYTNQKLLGICSEIPREKCIDCCKIITHLSSKSFNVQCPSDLSKKLSEPNKVLNYLVENSINQYNIPGATYSIYKAMVQNYSCGDLKVFFQPMLRKTVLISKCLENCKISTGKN